MQSNGKLFTRRKVRETMRLYLQEEKIMDATYNDIIVIVESEASSIPEFRQYYRCKVIRNITFSATTITIDIAEKNSFIEENIIIHKVPRLKIIIE